MKGKIKKTVCTILFLAIIGAVFLRITSICKFSNWTNVEYGFFTYSKLNHIAEYPVDVVAFGQSLCNRSFAAPELYGQYGMSAYNIGGSWQPGMVSYFLLKELLKHEKPKVVILESYSLFAPMGENAYRCGFDGLPFSSVKLEAINAHCKSETAESKKSYVFNILKYHKAWQQLNEIGFRKTNSTVEAEYYQGFRKHTGLYKASKQEAEFSGWTDTGTKEKDFFQEGLEYMTKFIQLCKENGIAVILYKDPHTAWNVESYNSAKKFADSLGVPYIDFHTKEVWQKSGFDFATDMADKNHDNTLGAIKVTRYLGDFIHENYDIPDHRGDPKYKALEDDYAKWQRELQGESFVFEKDMSAYLDKLLKEKPQNYTVIFSVKDSCQGQIGETIKSQLKQMGFKSDKIFKEWRHSFIGIYENGKVVYERESKTINNKDTDFLEYNGVFPDGKKYYISSAGCICGNESKIIINGKDYSKNSRGFNIVIYDNQTHRVVDSVCWDTHKDSGKTYKR